MWYSAQRESRRRSAPAEVTRVHHRLSTCLRSMKTSSLVLGFTLLAALAFAQVSLPPGAVGIYTPTKMKAYVSYCPLWRTDGAFQSTIRLSNMLAIANTRAQITLYMADGT